MKKIFLLSLLVPLLAVPSPGQAARLEQWLPIKVSEGLVTAPQLLPERKVGFIDKNGKTIIEPKFEAARPFCEGLAAVRVKDKWGYIDHSGSFVIQPKFDAVGVLDYPGDDPMDFSEGLAAVRIGGSDGRVGFIDKTGTLVVPAKYASAWQFSDGLAAVQDVFSGKWGYIDRSAKQIIKPQFTDARSFSGGLAPATTLEHGAAKGWGYIDKTGSFVISPAYTLALDFHEGLALVLTMKNGSYVGQFIDSKGNPSTNLNCHGGNSFAQGLAPVPLKNYKVGYIDKTGKTVIEPQFLEARSFNDDLAVVKMTDSEWGLIDRSGALVLKCSVR